MCGARSAGCSSPQVHTVPLRHGQGDIAAVAAALVFGARSVVTQRLYLADAPTCLAVAKIAMGYR
jgi:hypothetical protein